MTPNAVSMSGRSFTEVSRTNAIRDMVKEFETAGIPDPAHDARLLLCAVSGIEHAELIQYPHVKLAEDATRALEIAFRRRLLREPVSRILGRRGFWNMDFRITPDVLDPRPDSETLIDAALEALKDRQNEPLRIADLGTGSGALLCALLESFPHATGMALDVSDRACAVARSNLDSCGFQGRYTIRCGDWDLVRPGPFDLIVSNPPYIPTHVISELAPEVRVYDPQIALDGGSDGLEAYRQIAACAPAAMSGGGLIAIELGLGQSQKVQELLRASSLSIIGTRADLGDITRVILARLED